MERKRILFIGEAVTLSHVARPVALARALDPDLYDVTLACDPRFASLVANLPFRLLPIRSAIPTTGVTELLKRSEPLFDPQTLDDYVSEDLRLFRALLPDVVVGDMRHSLAVSSRLAGVPFVNIANAHWNETSTAEYTVPEHPMMDVLGEDVTQMFFRVFFPVGTALHALPINMVAMKRGLPPIALDVRGVYTCGDYVIYPDIPEITPVKRLPQRHSYVGPILWSPEVPFPKWWDALPTDRPLVYVSLGSSGQHRLLHTILRALEPLPVFVMAATTREGTGIGVPGNAAAAEYLPGFDAAKRSRLVICSGGTMPAQQALSAGAPILALPSNMDQLIYARLVAQAGAGELLEERKAGIDAVRHLAWKILSEKSYADTAARLSTCLERQRAPEHFQKLIASICASRVAV
jgi:UDP:flavonoid glycosyltransferase YjiC (YdhE family)